MIIRKRNNKKKKYLPKTIYRKMPVIKIRKQTINKIHLKYEIYFLNGK